MYKFSLNCLLLSTLFLGTIYGCKKDTFQVSNLDMSEADPNFAIPLGKATLNLGDLEQEFDNGELVYNANDELFRLIYQHDLFQFNAGELIELPSQELTFDVNVPVGTSSAFSLAPVGSSVDFSETLNQSFNFSNGEEVNTIVIESGNLKIDAFTDMQHDVVLAITIPYLTLNGQPYNNTIDLSYQGSSPTTDVINLDLSNYELDLTKNGQTFNEVEVLVDVNLTKTNQPYSGTESISMDMEINLNSFESIDGYFGNFQNIVAQDTQDLPVFDGLLSGEIHFANPQLNLYISSTAGLPLGITFNGLYDAEGGAGQSLGGPGLTNIPTIPGASSMGDTASFMHTIDNTNTNPSLSALIDANPQKIVFDLSAETNPDGYQQNFLNNDALAWGTAEVILPIYGYAHNFSFQDTADLNLEEELGLGDDSNFTEEDVESATLRLICTNGLPISLGAQIYFLDENDQVLDSLFQNTAVENLIEAGVVDNTLPVTDPNYGKVIASSQSINDVVLNQGQLKTLIADGTRKIIYKMVVNTTDSDQMQDVKFYPEYEISLQLSAKLNLNVNLNN